MLFLQCVDFTSLRLRMGAIIDRLQILKRDLRIFLGSGEAGVAEQFLDGPEVCAVAQQVSRVGMPKAVWVDSGIARHQKGVQLDQAADLTIAEPSATRVQKQSAFAGRSRASVQIAFDSGYGSFRNRDLPLLVSFAANSQPARVQINIFQVDTNQLTDADSAPIQEFQECMVSLFGLDAIKQVVSFLLAHHFGQTLTSFRSAEPGGNICLNDAFLEQELEHGAHRSEFAADADDAELLVV